MDSMLVLALLLYIFVTLWWQWLNMQVLCFELQYSRSDVFSCLLGLVAHATAGPCRWLECLIDWLCDRLCEGLFCYVYYTLISLARFPPSLECCVVTASEVVCQFFSPSSQVAL